MNDTDYLRPVASLAGLQHYAGKGSWGKSSGAVIGAPALEPSLSSLVFS